MKGMIQMTGKMETNLGKVVVSEEAIAKMAGYVATSCYGVVGMLYHGKVDGLTSFFKRDKTSKGIKVERTDDSIVIEMHIMVEYGINMTVIAESISQNVKYQLLENAGIEISEVRVFIDGVRCEEK